MPFIARISLYTYFSGFDSFWVFNVDESFLSCARQNRKNDELSYIRMLRLRRDMERAMYAPVPFALFVCLPHGHVLLALSHLQVFEDKWDQTGE